LLGARKARRPRGEGLSTAVGARPGIETVVVVAVEQEVVAVAAVDAIPARSSAHGYEAGRHVVLILTRGDPHLLNGAKMSSGHFWVIGHRGAPESEVENTIASFERALADGANGLELDLCVTADEEVVIWHDEDPFDWRARFRRLGLEPVVRYRPSAPSRRRFRRPTREHTLSELRTHFGYARGPFGRKLPARIPTLGEFMQWASEKQSLGLVFLDVKVPAEREDLMRTLVRQLDALILRHRPRFEIVLETPTAPAASLLTRLAPGHARALDAEPRPGLVLDYERPSAARAAIAHRLTHAAPQRPRWITLFPFATHRRIVKMDLARIARHNESSPEVPIEGLCSFTINRAREMRALIELGVWGIQSDRPALLRRVAMECGRSVEAAPERSRNPSA
jgi:glycerophosphoryl diester phosphodiesterase